MARVLPNIEELWVGMQNLHLCAGILIDHLTRRYHFEPVTMSLTSRWATILETPSK